MRAIVRFAALTFVSLTGAASIIALSSLSASAAVVISSAATRNMSCSGGSCVPTAKDAVLNVSDLTSMLASGNVDVNTGSGELATEVEDIIVSSGFSWSSANGLTLDAYRSISFKAGAVAVNGVGAVALATNDGGSDGQLSFRPGANLSFVSTANNLTINRAAYALENSIATLASAIAANPRGKFALANSYDASKDGKYHGSPIDTPLQGNVEGLGNTISNLAINSHPKSQNYICLFSEIETTATVADLALQNLKYNAYLSTDVGGLACKNNGLLSNDYASGSIRGGFMLVGGLVGLNGNSISSSQAAVSIRSPGTTAGGLAGMNQGEIALSSATGSVQGNDAGGLVGENDAQIAESFATGRVAGSYAGGLVGLNDFGPTSTLQNSYATGSVTGSPGYLSYVGGLIGQVSDNLQSSSYSTGLVSAASDHSLIGGLFGQIAGTGSTSLFWNTTTSQTNQATGQGLTDGLAGLTSVELKSGLPDGFDPAIWHEKKGVNHGFPYLINNPPPKN